MTSIRLTVPTLGLAGRPRYGQARPGGGAGDLRREPPHAPGLRRLRGGGAGAVRSRRTGGRTGLCGTGHRTWTRPAGESARCRRAGRHRAGGRFAGRSGDRHHRLLLGRHGGVVGGHPHPAWRFSSTRAPSTASAATSGPATVRPTRNWRRAAAWRSWPATWEAEPARARRVPTLGSEHGREGAIHACRRGRRKRSRSTRGGSGSRNAWLRPSACACA